jgi:hypothetical protein
MAHFAKLDENNKVIQVHVIANDVLITDGQELEQNGIDFLKELYSHEHWKQCSYNKSFRKHYPGPGWTYNPELDAFIPPKIWDSWILDTDICAWKAPVPYPHNEEGKRYKWDESILNWVETQE